MNNWSRIWFGQIAAVIISPFITMWIATQWVADTFAYQPQLGEPLFRMFGCPVYAPWNLFIWWYYFDAYAEDVFYEGGAITVSGAAIAIVLSFAATIYRAHQPKSNTYGSAEWGTLKDIESANLLHNDGVFLGKFDPKCVPFSGSKPRKNLTYLRHDGPEHVLAYAPTRSGKGVGLVIPTLLTWPESVVVHDLKKENWNITAGIRSKFSHALLFDPTSRDSVCFNPLLEVRPGDYEIRDVQNIADVLVDPNGSGEERSHWQNTAYSLFTGVILHILYAEKDKTLAGMIAFLSDPARPIKATLALMMSTKHLGKDGVHPVVAQCARELLNKSDNELSGVVSTAVSYLSLYRDPLVARATAKSEFCIDDLMNAEHPVSLYLAVPPSDASRTRPLIRLMLNQLCHRLTEKLDKPKHKLLLMLDEFPALGRLDFFETNLAFLAGYGIRAFLIAQSLNQLTKAYGPNASIQDNCHIRVAFATNDEMTAKRISDSLGTKTEHKMQQNFAGHRLGLWLGHRMVTDQEVSRPLATQGEIMQLPATDELLMIASTKPLYLRKIRYYEDPNFKKLLLPPPTLRDDGTAYVDVPPKKPDDWSGRPTREEMAAAEKEKENGNEKADADTEIQREVDLDHKKPRPSAQEKTTEIATEEIDNADVQNRDLMAEAARQAQRIEMDREDDLQVPL